MRTSITTSLFPTQISLEAPGSSFYSSGASELSKKWWAWMYSSLCLTLRLAQLLWVKPAFKYTDVPQGLVMLVKVWYLHKNIVTTKYWVNKEPRGVESLREWVPTKQGSLIGGSISRKHHTWRNFWYCG